MRWDVGGPQSVARVTGYEEGEGGEGSDLDGGSTWGAATEGPHLNSYGELDLVQNKGDQAPTADRPTCHQLPTKIQDSHLQQHP